MHEQERKNCNEKVSAAFKRLWNWSKGQFAVGLSSSSAASYFSAALLRRFMDAIPAYSLGTAAGVIIGFSWVYGIEKENQELIDQTSRQLTKTKKETIQLIAQTSRVDGRLDELAAWQLHDYHIVRRNKLLENYFARLAKGEVIQPNDLETKITLPRSNTHSPLSGTAAARPPDMIAIHIDNFFATNLTEAKAENLSLFRKLWITIKNTNTLTKVITAYYALMIGYYLDYSLEEIAGADKIIALPCAGMLTLFATPLLLYACSNPSRSKLAKLQNELRHQENEKTDLNSKYEHCKGNYELFKQSLRSAATEQNLNAKMASSAKNITPQFLFEIFKAENERKTTLPPINYDNFVQSDQVTVTTPFLLKTGPSNISLSEINSINYNRG